MSHGEQRDQTALSETPLCFLPGRPSAPGNRRRNGRDSQAVEYEERLLSAPFSYCEQGDLIQRYAAA